MYKKGQVIVQEGDNATRTLFVILQGSVGAFCGYGLPGQSQVDVLSPGRFFGEMTLFLGKDHECTMVSLTDSLVFELVRKNIPEFFSAQPDMAFSVMEGLCGRLEKAEAELKKYTLTSGPQSESQQSALFPEGHGSYLLNLTNSNQDMLYEQKLTCPVCGYSFPSLTVIASRLRLERTDKDQRPRYKGVEPLYYEIVTCPSCLLSATMDQFPNVSKGHRESLEKKVGAFRLGMEIKTGVYRDTFAVFAGYYLALLCAEVCFDDHQMITGSLWQKVSRLYQDAEDEGMFQYASQKALGEYLYAYENFRISERLMPQLVSAIAELYARMGEFDRAREYYFQVKMNKAASPMVKRQADLRLEELKELRDQQLGK
jgi:uncharacterized protein (DUF2225 family)